MQRYLISFDDGSMIIPQEDLPAVSEASHRVVQDAKDAGVWIFGAGVIQQHANVVDTNGSVSDRPYPDTKASIGGFSILEVSSHEAALEWAGKFAVACRCAQEVRELGYNPES